MGRIDGYDSIQQTLLKNGKFDEANRCTREVYKENVELRFLDKKIKNEEENSQVLGGTNAGAKESENNFLSESVVAKLRIQGAQCYNWLEMKISLYLGKLIQDGQRLVWYSIGWILIFALTYTFIPGNDLYSAGTIQNCEPLAQGILLEFFNHLYISLMLFISFGFPGGITFCDSAEYMGLIRFFYVLNVSMGVVHVSVYIAYLYSILLRR